jgi:hypothetical protein
VCPSRTFTIVNMPPMSIAPKGPLPPRIEIALCGQASICIMSAMPVVPIVM